MHICHFHQFHVDLNFKNKISKINTNEDIKMKNLIKVNTQNAS